MSGARLTAVARSWGGLAAAAIALCSAVWLTAEYVQAVRVAPAEKALVEALKVQARTDATVHQKRLQPEFDRQRVALERRHAVYNRVGPSWSSHSGSGWRGSAGSGRSRASGSACRRACSDCWKATSITPRADPCR